MTASDDLGGVRPPRNIKVVLEYDGTRFCGWERQNNGLGIQQVVEDAVEQITQERTTVNGSGRTDAGVHAEGQVATFTLQNPIAAKDLHRALNAVLPEDVAVLELDEVSLYFHARFSAVQKHYRYTVLQGRVRAPLTRHRHHHVRAELDLDAMERSARHLVGRHDFTAFCREPELVASCVRTVDEVRVSRHGREIHVDVKGEGFLYNMVRIIVGTLVHVGLRRIDPDEVAEILASGDRTRAGPTFPACGLSLVGVDYEHARADPGSADLV